MPNLNVKSEGRKYCVAAFYILRPLLLKIPQAFLRPLLLKIPQAFFQDNNHNIALPLGLHPSSPVQRVCVAVPRVCPTKAEVETAACNISRCTYMSTAPSCKRQHGYADGPLQTRTSVCPAWSRHLFWLPTPMMNSPLSGLLGPLHPINHPRHQALTAQEKSLVEPRHLTAAGHLPCRCDMIHHNNSIPNLVY